MKSECSTAYTRFAPARLAMNVKETGAGAEVEDHVAGLDVAVDAAVVRVDTHRVGQHLLVLGEPREVGLVHEVVDDAHQSVARRDLLGRESDRRSNGPRRRLSRPIDHVGRLRRVVDGSQRGRSDPAGHRAAAAR